MIIEISCVLGVLAILILLIKERDSTYLIGFILGLLVGLWIEPQGILNNLWQYSNIVEPFNYPIFGVPICIYLLYGSIFAAVAFLNKSLIELRKNYKDKLDKTIGYSLIAVGIVVLVLTVTSEISIPIASFLIMTGFYLLVKNPVVFYVGATALLADFVFEHLFMLDNQIVYTDSYGSVGVGFFVGGVILSSVFLLISKHFSNSKK